MDAWGAWVATCSMSRSASAVPDASTVPPPSTATDETALVRPKTQKVRTHVAVGMGGELARPRPSPMARFRMGEEVGHPVGVADLVQGLGIGTKRGGRGGRTRTRTRAVGGGSRRRRAQDPGRGMRRRRLGNQLGCILRHRIQSDNRHDLGLGPKRPGPLGCPWPHTRRDPNADESVRFSFRAPIRRCRQLSRVHRRSRHRRRSDATRPEPRSHGRDRNRRRAELGGELPGLEPMVVLGRRDGSARSCKREIEPGLVRRCQHDAKAQ